jgi:hypothetical protein
MGRKNKYNNFPPRKQVPVGGVCLLCECNRQVRKAARPYVIGTRTLRRTAMLLNTTHALGFPAQCPKICPGMIFAGINNETGKLERFKVLQVPWKFPDRSSVERVE